MYIRYGEVRYFTLLVNDLFLFSVDSEGEIVQFGRTLSQHQTEQQTNCMLRFLVSRIG